MSTRVRRRLVCTALAGAVGLPCLGDGLPGFAGVSETLEGYLATRPELDGAGLLLMDFDGRVLHERYWGTNNRATVVPIASATKWLSGAVIADLIADGLLSLDTRVGDVLPEFNAIDDGRADMTVSQLFSHTAGTISLSPEVNRDDVSLATAVSNLAGTRNLMRHDPGSTFRYGGVSMHIAGRMAEVATSTGWVDLIDERLFAPLGVTDTDYNGIGNELNPRIAGGMRSSIETYRRLLMVLAHDGQYDGQQVLDPSAIDAMLTDYTGFGTPEAAAIGYTPGTVENFLGHGLGTWVGRRNDAGQVTEWMNAGALGTIGWLDVEHGYLGIFLVEDDLPNFMGLIEGVRLDAAGRIAAGLAALPGDFDGSGSVEQGDLDRILNGWGTTPSWELTAASARPNGVIDQEELDAVLNHWGASEAPSFRGASIPEPGGLYGLSLMSVSLVRWRHAAFR